MTATRKAPRTLTQAALDAALDALQDHVGAGTQPAPECPWAARGMRCDCLACVAAGRRNT